MVLSTSSGREQYRQYLVTGRGDCRADMEQAEVMISTTATPGDSTATPPSPSFSNHQTSGKRLGQDTVDDARNDVHDSVMLNGDTERERQWTGNRLYKSLPLCPSPELPMKEEDQEGPQHFVVEIKSEQEMEAPLDFSLKRRDTTSEAYMKDSKTVSSTRSHPCHPITSLSSHSSPDTSQDHQQSAGPRHLRHDSDSSHEDQDQGYRLDGSPDAEHGTPAGLASLGTSASGRGPGAATNISLAALGFLPEGSASGVTPAALSAVLGQNGAMMGSLNGIPTILEARKLQVANGGKVQRPFKAYPKEVLQMPLGYFGLPGVSPFPSIDPNFLQGLTVLPEDVMTMYKQQADFLKEREKQTKNVSKRGSRSPPSTAVPTSSASTASNGSSQVKTPPPPSSTPARPSHLLHPCLSSTQTASPPPDPSAEAHTSSTASLTHAHSPVSLAVSQGADSTPSTSSGTPLVSSTSSVTAAGGSRKRPRTLPDAEKDDAYWERRRKNNDAAKRSRDARRAKEDEIAIRAALLEQENLKLRVEVATLKTETARLRCLLYKT